MQHLSDRVGRTLGWCATLVGAVLILPVLAFLIITLRVMLLPVALAAGVVLLALVFFGPPRFRNWICNDWENGDRR